MREECNAVMNKLMEGGPFKKEDFYQAIRHLADDPRQVIDLWEQTRDEYVEVGWIESNGWGTYKKAEEPKESDEPNESDETQTPAE